MSRLKFTPKVKQKLQVSQALLYSASAFAFAGVACVAVFLYSNFGTSHEAFASGTCPGVPYFEVNLTGHSDSIYVSPSISRSGQCCSASNPDRCIEFGITLDANTEGVKLEIASGAQPSGSMSYYVNCLNPTPIG